MNAPDSDLEEREERLGELFSEWLESQERGSPPNRQEWLACHPEHAVELAEFIEEEERLRVLAAPLRETAQAALLATPLPGEPGHARNPLDLVEALPGPFGDCELLEEIGRGGMAVVYRARQKSLGRFVALKLFRADLPGQGGSDLQRFRHESEVVAQLDHPLIVPIHEVGEQSGRVYFTMKLLEGGSLDAHLDRFRADLRAAATLMVAISRAVHHAHQRGILHRDLKPSNILLSGGVDTPLDQWAPHVSDFGLAKRIGTDLGLTHSGAVLGTPAYMAPEQAAGESHRGAVTLAADVYGLGAILYALLTGKPPFRAESVLQTLDQVKGSEPRPPTRDNPKIPRDLETICLKCLRKEPRSRYESASTVADDLERWLRGEPIQGRPVRPVERLWRWCRRQPVQATLAAALGVAVISGVSLVVWQWRRAEENYLESERRRVEAVERKAEADDSLRLAHQVVQDFTTGVEGRGQLEEHGLEPLRRELLSKAQTYFRTFLQRRGDDPAFRGELAGASARLADIMRLTGSPEKALDAYRRALVLYEALRRDDPDRVSPRLEHAKLHSHIAAVHESLGRRPEALDSIRRARSLLSETLLVHPKDIQVRYELACSIHNTGMIGSSTARIDETRALFEEARSATENLLLEKPTNPDFQGLLGDIHNNTGVLLIKHGRVLDALKSFREAAALRQRLVERLPNRPAIQRALGESLCNVGEALYESGQLIESMKMYGKAGPLLEALTRISPHVQAYRLQLGLCFAGVGQTQHKGGDFRGALQSFERARKIFQQLVQEQPTTLDYQGRLERAWLGVAGAESHLGDAKKTQFAYEQARDIQVVFAKKYPNEPEYSSRLAVTLHNVALMLAIQGRLEDARSTLLRAVSEQRRALGLSPEKQVYRHRLSGTFTLLAQLERDLGRPDRAVDVSRERRDLWTGNANELYSVAGDFALTAAGKSELKARQHCIDLALDTLRRAVKSGFRDARKAQTDPTLRVLRNLEEFRKLWTERAGD